MTNKAQGKMEAIVVGAPGSADPTERFGFGKNWAQFLTVLNESRIDEAVKSLKEKLNVTDLNSRVFLDIGSGSGLFSLAASRLGATVHSFDYDTDSVACTQYLKDYYGAKDAVWTVEQGSVLDKQFLEKFPKADIVYSWGVLHHTGHMIEAFENVATRVKDGGRLFISIYNDQGRASRHWTWVKKAYIEKGPFIRWLLTLYVLLNGWTITFIKDLLKGNPLKTWRQYGDNNRGMSAMHDVVDWVGGYPFEVATPELVFNFFAVRKYSLLFLKTCGGGLGCNEFVFVKNQ